MRTILFVVALLIFAASAYAAGPSPKAMLSAKPALAASDHEIFGTARGGLSCSEYTQAYKANPSSETIIVHMWSLGYMSAINLALPGAIYGGVGPSGRQAQRLHLLQPRRPRVRGPARRGPWARRVRDDHRSARHFGWRGLEEAPRRAHSRRRHGRVRAVSVLGPLRYLRLGSRGSGSAG